MKWVIILAAALASAAVCAQDENPFDSRRVRGGARTSLEAIPGATAPQVVKKGVVCGLDQTMDQAKICVDGVWMGLAQFEAKAGQVARVDAMRIWLKNGKSYALGDALPQWQAAAKVYGGKK